MAMQRREDEVPIGDRLISAAPYLLPIADGIGCVVVWKEMTAWARVQLTHMQPIHG